MLTREEHIAYWQKLAEADLEVARGFLQRGHDLHYCLFFGHLSLEKTLKALIVAVTQEMPPRIHDLLRLAEKAGLIWKHVIRIINWPFINVARGNLLPHSFCKSKRLFHGCKNNFRIHRPGPQTFNR